MTDSLRLLATVAHLQAKDSGKNLEDIANQQKGKIGEKSKLREVQKYYDKIIADDRVDQGEWDNLQRLRGELGGAGILTASADMDATAWKGTGADRHLELGNTAEDTQNARAKQGMEAIKSELDGAMDGLNDDQQLLQFEIQMATSEMQNAESTRSQSEKRMEDQRKELRRNWAP